MRIDEEFNIQHRKEQRTTKFILDNGFLQQYNIEEVKDSRYQVKGVDLSCTFNSKPLYIDLKLKNSGYLDMPCEPSQRWSVEISRQIDGNTLSGWFTQADSMTDLYVYLDAKGNSFDSLEEVSCTFFSKSKMKKLIEETTGKTMQQIYDDSLTLLDSEQKLMRYNNMQLYKSCPDRKANSPVVNLCFDRDFIDGISKKTTISRK